MHINWWIFLYLWYFKVKAGQCLQLRLLVEVVSAVTLGKAFTWKCKVLMVAFLHVAMFGGASTLPLASSVDTGSSTTARLQSGLRSCHRRPLVTLGLWFFGCTANRPGKNGVCCLKILLNVIISHKTELHEDNWTKLLLRHSFMLNWSLL